MIQVDKWKENYTQKLYYSSILIIYSTLQCIISIYHCFTQHKQHPEFMRRLKKEYERWVVSVNNENKVLTYCQTTENRQKHLQNTTFKFRRSTVVKRSLQCVNNKTANGPDGILMELLKNLTDKLIIDNQIQRLVARHLVKRFSVWFSFSFNNIYADQAV